MVSQVESFNKIKDEDKLWAKHLNSDKFKGSSGKFVFLFLYFYLILKIIVDFKKQSHENKNKSRKEFTTNK